MTILSENSKCSWNFWNFAKRSHNKQSTKLKNWVKWYMWVSQIYWKNGLMLYEMRVLTFDVASQVFILSRSELRSQATLNFLQDCGVSREVVVWKMFWGWDLGFFIFTQSLRFSLMALRKKKTGKLDNRPGILFTNNAIAFETWQH